MDGHVKDYIPGESESDYIYLEKVKVIIYLEKVKVELAPFEHPFDMLLNIIFNIFAHRMS